MLQVLNNAVCVVLVKEIEPVLQDRKYAHHVIGRSLPGQFQVSNLSAYPRVSNEVFQLYYLVLDWLDFFVHFLQVGQIGLEILLVVPHLLHQGDLKFDFVVLFADSLIGELLNGSLAFD